MKNRPTKVNTTERQRKKQRQEVDKIRRKAETRDKPRMKGEKRKEGGNEGNLTLFMGNLFKISSPGWQICHETTGSLSHLPFLNPTRPSVHLIFPHVPSGNARWITVRGCNCCPCRYIVARYRPVFFSLRNGTGDWRICYDARLHNL